MSQLIVLLFLIWLLPPLLLWASFRGRVSTLARSLQSLEDQLSDLLRRIEYLESTARKPAIEAPAEGSRVAPAVKVAPTPPRLEAKTPSREVPGAAVKGPEAKAPEAPPMVTKGGVPRPGRVPEPTPAPAHIGVVGRLLAKMGETIPRRGMSVAEWETLVGGNLLNKLGIVIFVVGVALLLGYSLRYFGPFGRIGTGAATGLALLAGGLVLERRASYAVFARSIIGGGWAILYFTAYATYNIAASKIVDEPGIALLAMGVVAVGIIGHSFRYRSQVVTGLAYGLAYLAIVISPLSTFSLVAIGLLAASLLAVVRILPWYHLATVGLAGTYLCHFLWLRQSGASPGAEAFWINQGVLVFYWLLFTTVAFVKRRQPPKKGVERSSAKLEERALLTLGVGNAAGFFALAASTVWSAYPDEIYLLTGNAAVAYAAVAYLMRVSGRAVLMLFNASVAIGLAALTAPLALRAWPSWDPEWLALYWAVEAGIVVALGLHLRQIVLRIESYLLCLTSLIALFAVNLSAPTEGRQLLVWFSVVPVIAFFFYLFEKLKRVAGQDDVREEARNLGIVLGYAATAVLAALLWREASYELLGPIWLLVGLAFFELGLATRRPHLRGQGYVLITLAAAALFLTNLYEVYLPSGAELTTSRWVLIPPSVAIYYYVFWRLLRVGRDDILSAAESLRADVPSYVATALLAVLLWRELPSVAVALSWGVLGLALFEVGAMTARPMLRLQGHLVLAACFGRLFMANFTSTTDTFGISHRLITVLPLTSIAYYLFWRLRELGRLDQRLGFERQLDVVYSYAGAALLVLLARFEFGRAYTVMAWAPLMLIWLVWGVERGERDFRFQSYILGVLAFSRSWATNVYLTGSFYGVPERYATTVPMIAAFLVAALYCIRRRDSYVDAGFYDRAKRRSQKLLGGLDVYSRALFAVLGPALIAILLFHEVSGNVLTMAWSLEAFLVLALGFVVVERSFRLFGLALLAVCLIKLLVIDLREVETLYRILSYIVLGILLLLASFAYTRYREMIRRFI